MLGLSGPHAVSGLDNKILLEQLQIARNPDTIVLGGDAWVGRRWWGTQTLTLFQVQISDSPTLFNTEFRFFRPCL